MNISFQIKLRNEQIRSIWVVSGRMFIHTSRESVGIVDTSGIIKKTNTPTEFMYVCICLSTASVI